MSELIPIGKNRLLQGPNSAMRSSPPSPDGPEASNAEERIDLREMVATLRRQYKLVLAVAVVVLGATAYYVSREQPLYRARAVIRLLDERQALAGGMLGTAMEGTMGKANDPLLSQLEVLKSRAVAGAVVDRLGLQAQFTSGDLPATFLDSVSVLAPSVPDTFALAFDADAYSVRVAGGEPVRAPYGREVALAGVEMTVPSRPAVEEATLVFRDRGRMIDWVLGGLRATPRERTDVVDVIFTTTRPELAQEVVNAVVEEYRAHNGREAQQQSRRRRIFVEEQLAQTDSVLGDALLALTEFQRRESVYSSQQKFSAQQTGLSELEMRREELDADRRMLMSLMQQLERPGDSGRSLRTLVSSPGVAENPVIGRLYEQMVRHEATRDSLTSGSAGRAETDPDVQRLNQLIESTRGRLVEAVGSHVAALEARVAALDQMRARTTADLQALPATGAEEVRLVQRVETLRKIADQLREEHQKARITEAMQAGQVEVVDLATLPGGPIGSGKGLKLALGLLFGLMLGCGGAVLREQLNTSIRRKEDLEGMLQVPGLAVIPQIASRGSSNARLRLPGRIAGIGNGNGNGNGHLPALEELNELVTISDLRSSGSEAYRTLRTNLIFSQAVQSLRTIVVTSSSPAEGKTTTAANLAVTFAQQGMRVVIIDGDLRKARLHKVFGIEREPGLTHLMLGTRTLEEVVQPTAVEGLYVTPAGALPPNPSELLGGERMREILQSFQAEFDLVIVDSPPLLAAADAAVLGTLVDGVLVVVRAGYTDRSVALQALRQLRAVGANVIGAVLNDPDAKVAAYGGYYYYNYYGVES